jgi:Zn-dependent peptidase ImmA (M78 family)
MTSPDPLGDPASALLEAAHAFQRAAETRGSHIAAPDSLASLQDALQILSSAWYRLAADAGPVSNADAKALQ